MPASVRSSRAWKRTTTTRLAGDGEDGDDGQGGVEWGGKVVDGGGAVRVVGGGGSGTDELMLSSAFSRV